MRQATKVRAFKWDAATRDWELVGDVTDAKNNVIDGVEYDQVINVTLDNGNRRLGYMNGGAYACCTLSCTSSIDAHAARQRTPTLRRSAFCSRTRTFRATTRTSSSTLSFATSNDASHRRSPWAVVLVAAPTPSPATPAGTRALPLRPLRLRPRFVHRPPILYVRSCWQWYLVCPHVRELTLRAVQSKIIPLAPTYSCFPQQTVVLFSTTNFEKLRAALNKLLDEAPRPTDDNSPLVTAAEREELSRILTKAEQKAATTRFSASQVRGGVVCIGLVCLCRSPTDVPVVRPRAALARGSDR